MSYVRDTDPLPRNSYDPQTQCEADRASCIVNGMEQSVANAQWASGQIAGPGSFSQFGPAVVIDVARSQNAMVAAGRPVVMQQPSVSLEMMAAPTVLPLNVTPEEYNGCKWRSGAILPTPVTVQKSIPFPPRAPVPVVVPQTASAPRYANLCWALRNGAVDVSQFDPAQLQALQWKCTQMGYAGACLPPPNIALWLDQQRRAGTLPRISVSQAELDVIPPAPDLTNIPCAQSWTMGGMSGYRRGMGAPWGDAGSVPTTPGWMDAQSQASAKWKALLFFGALGVGLYWMAGQHGRG